MADTLGAGLSAPTDSALGIAAASASPAMATAIGDYFDGLAQSNQSGTLTAGQETAHVLAQGILGAAVAAAGDNNAFTAGLAAGTSEAAAPILSNWLYGTSDPEQLSADQKATLTSIASLAGTAIGATTGNGADIAAGSQLAENAVENNWLSLDQAKLKNTLESKLDQGTLSDEEQQTLAALNALDELRDDAILSSCTQGNKGSAACLAEVDSALQALSVYDQEQGYMNYTAGEIYAAEDYANIQAVLDGLSANDIYQDTIISNLAESSGLSYDEVAQRYFKVQAAVIGVGALASSRYNTDITGVKFTGKAVPSTGVIAVGESTLATSMSLPTNGTIKLTQSVTLSNGKTIPAGSVVVNSDNSFGALTPEGQKIYWNGNTTTVQKGIGFDATNEPQVFYNLAPQDPIRTAKYFPASQIQKISYNGKLNYVVTESGELFIGKSGHIDLSQGSGVLAAGEAKFVNGEIKMINNLSGHYKPSGSSAQNTAETAFERAGFSSSGKYIEGSF